MAEAQLSGVVYKSTRRYTSFLYASQLYFMFCESSCPYEVFSVIATDDHHLLWSCSIYQNAAFGLVIHSSYISQSGG